MIDTEKIPLTEADTAAYDSTAQILKAAMAYVNPSIGRMMAIMAKSIELRHMMQYLDQGGVSACGVNNRAIPPEEVIRDLRKYCGAKEKEQLDRCLNMMNMAKMYEMYRNFSGSGDLSAMASMMASASGADSGESTNRDGNTCSASDTDYLRKMQSMLTPEQIQLIRHMNGQQNT
ncbi:MAG: hypothetical protein ACLS2X_07700 [Coprococcus sp.]